jgi:hypothetical protein
MPLLAAGACHRLARHHRKVIADRRAGPLRAGMITTHAVVLLAMLAFNLTRTARVSPPHFTPEPPSAES